MKKTRALPLVLACIALLASAQPAVSGPWQIGPFTRPADARPVVVPNPSAVFMGPIRMAPVHWEALHTFNPAAVVRDGKVYLLDRAEDNTGAMRIGMHTSRLGLAVSSDGFHFTQFPAPVFYPSNNSQKNREWPGGVEDPRIVETENHTYVLTYTQWNRKTFSVGIATSPDLEHWTKYGPAFLHADGGKYAHLRYKSAAIVTALRNGRLIAVRIHGSYWMVWGEGAIHLATSPDLIRWTPVENAHGEPFEVLRPRPGHFDSAFPEAGPPPVLTHRGIVVIYNGRNAVSNGDPNLPPGRYSVGEALLDAQNPAHLLARTDNPVLQPVLPWEKTGQFTAGTTFAEGLVLFRNRWFLYYGAADTFVGVVTAPCQPEKSSSD